MADLILPPLIMTTTGDDFLTQVQEAEAKAQNMISKAHEKQRKDLEKESQVLAKAREASLGKVKEEGKKELEGKKKENKALYEKLLREGDQEVQQFRAKVEQKTDGAATAVAGYFLSEIL